MPQWHNPVLREIAICADVISREHQISAEISSLWDSRFKPKFNLVKFRAVAFFLFFFSHFLRNNFYIKILLF